MPQTLHAWVRQHEIDDGHREGVSTQPSASRSWREVRELRKANEILKLASVFRPGGARPPHQVPKAFVDQHRQQFGVESICRVMQIAPSA